MVNCPRIRRKSNGVPIVSKEQIDNLAEKILSDYNPSSLCTPQEIDVDDLAECYFGFAFDFQYLSHNGTYLGMMVFNDTDRAIVYSPETKRAEYIHADANTIIIDNQLLEDNQKRRYRFTVGHEIGHGYLHPEYYCYNPDQLTFLEYTIEPMVKCRKDVGSRATCKNKLVDDNDWMEWQANYMSAALCMPKKAIEIIAKDCGFYDKKQGNQHQLHKEIVNTFNVSVNAAANRMREFGYDTNKFSLVLSELCWEYD